MYQMSRRASVRRRMPRHDVSLTSRISPARRRSSARMMISQGSRGRTARRVLFQGVTSSHQGMFTIRQGVAPLPQGMARFSAAPQWIVSLAEHQGVTRPAPKAHMSRQNARPEAPEVAHMSRQSARPEVVVHQRRRRKGRGRERLRARVQARLRSPPQHPIRGKVEGKAEVRHGVLTWVGAWIGPKFLRIGCPALFLNRWTRTWLAISIVSNMCLLARADCSQLGGNRGRRECLC
mmetsp:Transcript_44688/g.83844  ORF Transcript_44688/g.83844 Transcript_44688/m.83844 type:complete len:235 (-) Transcript_44688:1274-1978(-)